MSKAELLEELQAEISDHADCGGISDALSCAEICETLPDFRANLEEAIECAEAQIKGWRELLERAKS